MKQRRFVAAYVRSGNGTQAALAAYDTDDPGTAHAIASENLRKPAIQGAVSELLDAEGLSDEKLLAIHAHYLSLCTSTDSQLKALGLKALDMAYKLKGAYAPEQHRIEAVPHVPAGALPLFDLGNGQAVLPRRLRHRRLTPHDAQHQRDAALGRPPLYVLGNIRHRDPPLRGLRTTVVWVASTWRGAV